jgi:exopolyphosphatase / guanosine-5'-triphosphate,3'-diphosphate pyrophosphatase
MWRRHDAAMVVGVVDVGANTVRLQVSRGSASVHRSKAVLRLGEPIERFGRLPEEKIDEAAAVVARFAREARKVGVRQLEVLVTSPGRQAENGDELLERLTVASGAPVRVLDAVEEGRLGFIGATSVTRGPARRLVAVVDVGGGSAQIAVGTRRDGPAWIRSLDIGSMRLTSRMAFSDPPGDAALERARSEVEVYLEEFVPPLAESAIAVGGSARALKSIAGSRLGTPELADVLSLLGRTPASEVVARYGVHTDRSRTLPAGAVILAAVQARLGVPLRVGRGGIREGALLELEREREAA